MRHIEKDETHIDYRRLTKIQKILIDRGYLYDPRYPSYYWKLIACIYLTIFKKELPRVNNTNKKSIKDLCKEFCESYTPFKDSIDFRDKVILTIYNNAKLGLIYETEIATNLIFLSQVNFDDFFYSLEHFDYITKEYISYPPINIDFLIENSLLIKELSNHSPNLNKDINRIINDSFKKSNQNVVFILRKISNGNYKISLKNLMLAINVCNIFFSDSFIKNSIIFWCKFNNVPQGIILIIYPKFTEYENIDLKWYVKNCCHNGLNDVLHYYPINKNNYISIGKECNTINMFRKIFHSLDNSYDREELFRKYALVKIKSGVDNLGDISDICTDFKILDKIKYEILSYYIENLNYEAIKNGNIQVGGFNYYCDIIYEAVGKSCSIEMYNFIYPDQILDKSIIKIIIIASLKKESRVFIDEFPEIIAFNSKHEILNNIIPLCGFGLFKQYRVIFNTIDICNILYLSIKNYNDNLFIYICNKENCHYMISKNMLMLACINKQYKIIEIIINHDINFLPYIDELPYDKKILKLLLIKLATRYNLNDFEFQYNHLFRILTESKYLEWLNKNITILVRKRTYSDGYISSDTEE